MHLDRGLPDAPETLGVTTHQGVHASQAGDVFRYVPVNVSRGHGRP